MQINTLKLSRGKKKRKLIGRGGKRGTYSGRGVKGQKARSGASIDPLFEGGRSSLVDRMKKVRGFVSPRQKAKIFKISDLAKKFKENDIINAESLFRAGLLGKKNKRRKIKILGGESGKGTFQAGKGISFSVSAGKYIRKAEEESGKPKAGKRAARSTKVSARPAKAKARPVK